ncbi:MAG TPA: thioredoxin domain-containing protein [Myxococcales bacterium]
MTREEVATKLIHFTARWCPFCPASERAFHLLREKHPRLQAELVDVDEDPALADRYHIDAVPSDVIVGGQRPIHGACYDLDDFEAFWRNATEKPEKKMPAKKPAKKIAKKTAARKPVKKIVKKPARKAVRAAKKPAKKAKR